MKFMKRKDWLRIVSLCCVIIMITAFILVPEKYPWYYEVLAFNIGLWPWLLTKRELRKAEQMKDGQDGK